MNELLNMNHIQLMQISFLIMLALSIIMIGYSFTRKNNRSSQFIVFGNLTYMLFFFVISVDIGIPLPKSPIIVACLDLSAIIFWMMSINAAMSLIQPKKIYILASIINVVTVGIVYDIYGKFSIARSVTSLIIVFILIDTVIRLIKNDKIKKLNTFKFTVYSMLLFASFKLFLTINRVVSMQNEITIWSIESSVNVLTFISLIFAIWINFTVNFFNYDILHNDMKELSLRDDLTKLPNRRMIMAKLTERFELYLRQQTGFALALVDIDNFKNVNDKYGHNIGDEVLVELSQFLEENIRNIDFVGRYGGEEFIFLIYVDDFEESKLMLHRVLEKLSKRTFSTNEINISMSGGVVSVGMNDSCKDINEIISKADKRLYVAKEMGKKQLRFTD